MAFTSSIWSSPRKFCKINFFIILFPRKSNRIYRAKRTFSFPYCFPSLLKSGHFWFCGTWKKIRENDMPHMAVALIYFYILIQTIVSKCQHFCMRKLVSRVYQNTFFSKLSLGRTSAAAVVMKNIATNITFPAI